MARSVKDAKLDNRTQRLKLKEGKRHWKAISRGLALGYWRGTKSSSWLVRRALGNNKYTIYTLPGRPDDHEDADGTAVLDFYAAQDQARAWVSVSRKSGPYTVRQAVADYLQDFDGKSKAETERVCNLHILPKLGGRKVTELTTREIRRWRNGIQAAKPRVRAKEGAVSYREGDIDERARKATANRVLTVLKAVLNHAWRESGEVPSNGEWSKVKPYPKVDAPRVRFLSDDECRRLVNACSLEFRPMVQAALFTGARYGELTKLKVGDYNPKAGNVYIEPSKGKPRYTYLTDEGRRFFDRVALKRGANERMFLRTDGNSWAPGQQKRRIQTASERAKIDPSVTFHILRHTYGSQLAHEGVPLQVIAEAMGHSNVEITRKHYAHLMPSYVEKTIRGALPEYGFEEDNVAAIGGQL